MAPITPQPDRPPVPRLTGRQIRELIAVLLVLAGAVGLVVTAWLWSPIAGGALLSVEALVAGVFLGLDW